MAFYAEMQAMVADLLRPDTAGGLGQGDIWLHRSLPGIPDPETPWVELQPTVLREQLHGAISGAEKYADGKTILATDLRLVAAVPSLVDWRFPVGGDSAALQVTVDGRSYTVVSVTTIPSAGTPAAVAFFLRM